jgi:hypothetical protein
VCVDGDKAEPNDLRGCRAPSYYMSSFRAALLCLSSVAGTVGAASSTRQRDLFETHHIGGSDPMLALPLPMAVTARSSAHRMR